MHKKLAIMMIFGFSILLGVYDLSGRQHEKNIPFIYSSSAVEIASMTNYNNINSMFDEKISDYATYGFFPQRYQASLQATYHGIYTLDAIGKRDQVNETQVIDYIMGYYNSNTHLFIDEYAYRYLDTDFSHDAHYYPLTSMLEVNCYAILSLGLLNALDLIDKDASIDFIKSCYNPHTSGFIGQPYHPSLEYFAKISTMDNTYYAIKTLDVLMDDWTGYSQERNELILYINSLQVAETVNPEFGGFMNDNEISFSSLKLYTDINMFSTYYCIKSLEVFGMVGTINNESLNTFLEQLYVTDENYFHYMVFGESLDANIVTTALGLDLCRIMNFDLFNQSKIANFVFNNRNNLGIWDGSTEFRYHELIDTFQIIRVIKDCNLLSRLTFIDTNQITTSILEYFFRDSGFSLIAIDYTTLNLLNTIISSFDLYGRLPELDLQGLYLKISQTYYHTLFRHGFYAFSNTVLYGNSIKDFRSYPIEFYTGGKKICFKEIEYLISHKSTFYALNSLKTMFKLDDFAQHHNLNKLLNDILSTQFLNSSYPEEYGAFSYILPYDGLGSEFLSENIYFEYTYYAIKALELLVEQLDIGDLTFLDLNITALRSYISTHSVETSELLYFKPHYTEEYETILQNTYYMAYVLKAIDMCDLNVQKVRNFIEQNLNYSNFKNIYYSFKLAELLDVNIDFEIKAIQQLVGDIFSSELNEFYLTSKRKEVNQEIFLWICEMASLHNYNIIAQYQEEVMLGNHVRIEASLSNLILSYFDYNISFAFESDQLGYYEFERIENNKFSINLQIPQHPNNYPSVSGILYALNGKSVLAELSISFTTVYPKKVYEDEINNAIVLSILFITIPGGVIFYSEKKLKKRDSDLKI
ncbi:MAG: hypothetical protein ACFE94_18840 [Candidatus Hodarchaeota archaeon]